jgi:hypothetical protein
MNVTESVANTPSNPSRTPHNESPSRWRFFTASRRRLGASVEASPAPVSAAAASGARSCAETREEKARARRSGAAVCGRGERDARRGRGGVVGQRRVVVGGVRRVADRVFPATRGGASRRETAGGNGAECGRRTSGVFSATSSPRGDFASAIATRRATAAEPRARGMRGGY